MSKFRSPDEFEKTFPIRYKDDFDKKQLHLLNYEVYTAYLWGYFDRRAEDQAKKRREYEERMKEKEDKE